MNKQVKKFYDLAHVTTEKKVRKGGWDNDREPVEYRTVAETSFDPEKFAELIVRECARIANEKEEDFPQYEKEMSVHWYILKHFEIK